MGDGAGTSDRPAAFERWLPGLRMARAYQGGWLRFDLVIVSSTSLFLDLSSCFDTRRLAVV